MGPPLHQRTADPAPFLNEETSVGLLSAPASEFPRDAISEEVAREVCRRTGGQPYLLQVFGSLLVGRLNHQRRRVAEPGDVAAVEETAIEWAESYFRDLHRSTPEAVRELLGFLARGQAVELTPGVPRWLDRQYLLAGCDRTPVPLLADWLEHHALV